MGLLKDAAHAAERDLIVLSLKKHKKNISAVAFVLGIDRKTLYNKINLYKIPVRPDYDFSTPEKQLGIKDKLGGKQMIYLILDRNSGLTKIGRSSDPSSREKTIMSDRSTCELIWNSIPCHGYYERILHKHFNPKRIRGEWFLLNESDIEFIKSYDFNTPK